eukprot:6118736-Pyramimonas_sp.AAC.1
MCGADQQCHRGWKARLHAWHHGLLGDSFQILGALIGRTKFQTGERSKHHAWPWKSHHSLRGWRED